MSAREVSREAMPAAVVARFASRENQRAKQTRSAFALVLLVLVVLLLSAMMFVGTATYGHLAENRSQAAQMRAECGVLANCVRIADEIDSVAVGSGPEGKSLVLIEHGASENFETRIYAYQGAVLQEYSVEGSAYDPVRATEIAQSETFDFEYAHGLLTMYTDAGSTSIALRSVRGGA